MKLSPEAAAEIERLLAEPWAAELYDGMTAAQAMREAMHWAYKDAARLCGIFAERMEKEGLARQAKGARACADLLSWQKVD